MALNITGGPAIGLYLNAQLNENPVCLLATHSLGFSNGHLCTYGPLNDFHFPIEGSDHSEWPNNSLGKLDDLFISTSCWNQKINVCS